MLLCTEAKLQNCVIVQNTYHIGHSMYGILEICTQENPV